ncbi:TetR family transcriptional regulator [Brachybacterium phenoliresistens]|uniref:TetR family transcriptional regulator n=1 Tax=Brachybacterium phenoliresistens TaxID=396014 RepID=Z9JPI7_9MICO|nr:TetR/AcrR family transcriptional regulator [Brachybacterium phenoliresistens]EWS79662.1 TetR family transcriptional regulator [Brachybacterium phenoliresistens]
MAEQEQTPQRRPGGRSARIQQAVFAAVLKEVVAQGYAKATLGAVAERSGVHRTTIYRRWSDLDTLLVEALRDRSGHPVVPRDTGALATDLAAYAQDIVEVLAADTGRIISAVLGSEAARLDGVRGILGEVLTTRRPLSSEIVRRAVARGEAPRGTVDVEVIDHLVAPLYFRLLLTGEPLDTDVARRCAAATTAAVRAGIFVREPGPASGSPSGR